MRRSLSIGGSSSVQWRKIGRSWRLRMCFRRSLCVRIEIDQLQCVNCWVIIHCLSVSCTKINHSRCALVIWSSLQLTSKQWIITQQFTAGADLFLKYHPKDASEPFVQNKCHLPCGLLSHLLMHFGSLYYKIFYHKIINIFLSISLNMCFGCSKEPSHWDGSFEYPQHMFWLRNKKDNFQIYVLFLRAWTERGSPESACMLIHSHHPLWYLFHIPLQLISIVLFVDI